MSLRIGIDGRPMYGIRRGVPRYLAELCQEVDQLLPTASFFVYTNQSVELPVSSPRWHLRLDPATVSRYLSPVAWLKLRAGSLIRRDKIDVFWGTNIFLPSCPPSTTTISSVYDLSYKIVPETYLRSHMWALRMFFARDIRAADTLVALSKATSDRLAQLYGRPATAIVPPGIDSSFHPRSRAEVQQTLAALGIHQPYFLCVATWEPRKNLAGLIRAFASLKEDSLLPEHKLVLAGAKSHKYTEESALLRDFQGDSILDLDHVAEEHLPALYSGAEALVFPSLYEGFGMPVLEARACGTPVVTTDAPELREAGGEDSLYVQPTDEGIRQGILTILERSERPLPPASLPTWRTSAEILANVLDPSR